MRVSTRPVTMLTFSSLILLHGLVESGCNNYWQSTDDSSTKRPFDTCYFSQADPDGFKISFKYFCNASTNYGNHSVNGHTAFLETYLDVNCSGPINQTQVVISPFKIQCPDDNDNDDDDGISCDIMKKREYAILQNNTCNYNESVFIETTHVVTTCDEDEWTSDQYYCSDNYYWKNYYFDSDCNEERLYRADYTFSGCDLENYIHLEMTQCDYTGDATKTNKVDAFNEGVFVAGFILLIIAILVIMFILVWYCCWFRRSLAPRQKPRIGQHVSDVSAFADNDGVLAGDLGMEIAGNMSGHGGVTTSMQNEDDEYYDENDDVDTMR